MKIKFAPLIHARTKYVDFRSNFLITPCDFTEKDIRHAHSLVLDSTRFFELAGNTGRRVVFGNGKFVITGITIIFKELFNLCNTTPEFCKVDREEGRLAYGFVGMALPISATQAVFDVPVENFSNIYRNGVAQRWEETTSSDGVFETIESAYSEVEVPAASQIADLDPLYMHTSNILILEDDIKEREKIAAYALSRALRGEVIAFCSDIKMPKAIAESGFNIVTCKNANSIMLDNVQRKLDDTILPPISAEAEPRNRQAVPAESQKRRTAESLDDSLNRYSAPSDDSYSLNKKTDSHSKVNGSWSGGITSKISGDFRIQGLQDDNRAVKQKAVKSYDDIIKDYSAPDENDVHISMPSKSKKKWGVGKNIEASLLQNDSKQLFENPVDKNSRSGETENRINKTMSNGNAFNFYAIDAGIILGTIAGVTYTVIGLATQANPVVLATVGIFTIVFVGIEAKRILDRFDYK